MERLKRQLHLLKVLADPEVHSSVKKKLCLKGPTDLILVLCACGLNVLKGNCPVTKHQLETLKKSRKFVYKLADKNQNLDQKRKLVAKDIQKNKNSILSILIPVVLCFVHQNG